MTTRILRANRRDRGAGGRTRVERRRDYHRRKRALTSFTGPVRGTKASLEVSAGELGDVDDPAERARYAAEASRMAVRHEPDDAV